MDLRVYYQKLRQVETSLAASDVVLVSLATPDGGRAGVTTEAPRAIAARLIVDGAARLANEEEARKHFEQQAERRLAAEQAAAASRIQVTIVSEAGTKDEGRRQKPKGKGEQE